MKKLLLSLFLVAPFAMNAQVTVFEDGFESYEDFIISGYGGWSTLDFDQLNTYTGGSDTEDWTAAWPNAGAVMSYQIFNPSTASGEVGEADPPVIEFVSNNASGDPEERNFDPHGGAKYAAAWAGVPESNGQTATANDDWLISPPINLGGVPNTLKFWVKSLSDDYGLEKFRVYVTNNLNPTVVGDFTLISGAALVTAPNAWQEKSYTLNASFANTTVRLAVRCMTPDAYMFMVDDFLVTSANLGTDSALARKFSVYPNPSNGIVNLTNIESIKINSVKITDLNGRVVKTATFTDAVADIQINIADLSTGMYLMNIDSENGIAVKKIMKN